MSAPAVLILHVGNEDARVCGVAALTNCMINMRQRLGAPEPASAVLVQVGRM